MKIVHLCLAGPYNDNWGYQENILPKYHKKFGYEVTIITSILTNSKNNLEHERVSSGEYLLADGIKVIRLSFSQLHIKKIAKLLRIFNNTIELLTKEKPDIIFIHGCQFWDMHKVVKYLKRNPNVRVYFDNHADFSNSARNWISRNILHKVIWRRCAKIIQPYCRKIYGVLPARTKFLVDIYKMPREKVKFLPMGADDEKVNWEHKGRIRREKRKKFDIEDNEFLILTGGKIDTAKAQIILLIEAVKKMPQHVKLLIFGSLAPELSQEILTLCDGVQIHYIGWIDSSEVYEYFHASELGVFPGRHSVIWEQAVGTGLPCIFKYWEGTTHVDLGGNCEFLYSDSTDEIYNILKMIVFDKDRLKLMRDVAETKGVKYFSYKEIASSAIEM